MQMRGISAILSLILTAYFSACGADARLGEFHFAAGVDEQGRAMNETTVFRPGDTVYLSVELLDAYQGLESTATWKRGDEVLLSQTAATPRAADPLDPLFLVFHLETGADWPAGPYRCEVFVPDQGTTGLEFELR